MFSGASDAIAADVLFPQPLHITRTIEDPISRKTATVHEYCAGNQIVTVNGDRISIVDYAKQEMTEIDRAAGEYSVTRFDDIAKATPAPGARRVAAEGTSAPEADADADKRWKTTALGTKSSRSSRAVDAYEISTTEPGQDRVKIEVGLDRNVRLSRAAVEVLIGASFPNPRRAENDAILRVSAADRGERRVTPTANAASATPADAGYALPVEQTITIESEQQTLTFRNSIVDVRPELAPDGVKAIPPGARRVESRAVRLAREMRELDLLPSAPTSSAQ